MTKPDKARAFTTANPVAWEEATAIHGRHNQAQLPAAFRAPGV